MDKDVLTGKLQEFGWLLLCVVVILGAAYFTGFLKGFTAADFQDAYNKIIAYIPQNSAKPSGNNQTASRYQGYLVSNISQEVLRATENTYAFRNILKSDSKSVFYVYGSNSKYSSNFHYNLQNYISRSNVKTKYNIYAYSTDQLSNLRTGSSNAKKICNSLEECNEQRRDAADYTALQTFFERCSRTMCIINPSKNQFVMLRKRDYNEAVKMINTLQNW